MAAEVDKAEPEVLAETAVLEVPEVLVNMTMLLTQLTVTNLVVMVQVQLEVTVKTEAVMVDIKT